MSVRAIQQAAQHITEEITKKGLSGKKDVIAKADGEWLIRAATSDDGYITDDERRELIVFINQNYDALSKPALAVIRKGLNDEHHRKPLAASEPMKPVDLQLRKTTLAQRLATASAKLAALDAAVSQPSTRRFVDALWGYSKHRELAQHYVADAKSQVAAIDKRPTDTEQHLASYANALADLEATLRIANASWALYVGRGKPAPEEAVPTPPPAAPVVLPPVAVEVLTDAPPAAAVPGTGADAKAPPPRDITAPSAVATKAATNTKGSPAANALYIERVRHSAVSPEAAKAQIEERREQQKRQAAVASSGLGKRAAAWLQKRKPKVLVIAKASPKPAPKPAVPRVQKPATKAPRAVEVVTSTAAERGEQMRKAREAIDAAIAGKPTSFDYGRFFFALEGGSSETQRKWAESSEQVIKILESPRSGTARMKSVAEHLRSKFYSKYVPGMAMFGDLVAGRGGNCEAQTKAVVIAAALRSIELEDGAQLAVQMYANHVQPVIYYPKTQTVYELVSGVTQRAGAIDAPLYRPEILLNAALLGEAPWLAVPAEKLLIRDTDPQATRDIPFTPPKTNTKLLLPTSKSVYGDGAPSVAGTIGPADDQERGILAKGDKGPAMKVISDNGARSKHDDSDYTLETAIRLGFIDASIEDPLGVAPAGRRFTSADKLSEAQRKLIGGESNMPSSLAWGYKDSKFFSVATERLIVFRNAAEQEHYLSLTTASERDDYAAELLDESERQVLSGAGAEVLQILSDPSTRTRSEGELRSVGRNRNEIISDPAKRPIADERYIALRRARAEAILADPQAFILSAFAGKVDPALYEAFAPEVLASADRELVDKALMATASSIADPNVFPLIAEAGSPANPGSGSQAAAGGLGTLPSGRTDEPGVSGPSQRGKEGFGLTLSDYATLLGTLIDSNEGKGTQIIEAASRPEVLAAWSSGVGIESAWHTLLRNQSLATDAREPAANEAVAFNGKPFKKGWARPQYFALQHALTRTTHDELWLQGHGWVARADLEKYRDKLKRQLGL